MHNYDSCEKTLHECRWCLAKAEKLCNQNGFDTQELDDTLLFREQSILDLIAEQNDDGVHNQNARELMKLDKKRRSKKKGYPMPIGGILDGLNYLGAPIDIDGEE